MSPSAFSRVFGFSVNKVFKRFLLTLIRALLIYLISLLFVQLSAFWNYVTTLGKVDKKSEKQRRIRAKLTDDQDPSSPYRVIEVLDGYEQESCGSTFFWTRTRSEPDRLRPGSGPDLDGSRPEFFSTTI